MVCRLRLYTCCTCFNKCSLTFQLDFGRQFLTTCTRVGHLLFGWCIGGWVRRSSVSIIVFMFSLYIVLVCSVDSHVQLTMSLDLPRFLEIAPPLSRAPKISHLCFLRFRLRFSIFILPCAILSLSANKRRSILVSWQLLHMSSPKLLPGRLFN